MRSFELLKKKTQKKIIIKENKEERIKQKTKGIFTFILIILYCKLLYEKEACRSIFFYFPVKKV